MIAYNWKTKRKTPYTKAGIKRIPCPRCGEPSHGSWNICADKGNLRPVCRVCDILLNDLVLKFFGHPDRKELMKKYMDQS